MTEPRKNTFILIYSESPHEAFFTDFYSDRDFRTKVISAIDYNSDVFINNFFEAIVIDAASGNWEAKERFATCIHSIAPWVPIIMVAPGEMHQVSDMADSKTVISVVAEDVEYARLKQIIIDEVVRRREAMNKVFVVPHNFMRYNSMLDFFNSELAGDDTLSIMRGVAMRITREFPAMLSAYTEINHSCSFYCCSSCAISSEFAASLKKKSLELFADISEVRKCCDHVPERIECLSEIQSKNQMFQYLCSIPVFEDNKLTGLLSISVSRGGGGMPESEIILLYALMRQLSSLLRTFNKIRSKMIHDSLSGLYDHQYFQRTLKSAVNNAIEGEGGGCGSVSLILVDIDKFKNFNDSYGHFLGDEVIKDFASIILSFCHSGDVPGRFGGDEFAIILPNADKEKARSRALKLQERIRKHVFKKCGHPISFTASLGLATSSDPGINSASALFEAADAALYLAKRNGGNQLSCNHEMSKTRSPIHEAARIIGKSFKKENNGGGKSKGRILLVDDNLDVLKMLKMLLTKKDFDVTAACNGVEALDIVRTSPEKIDLVISDINMPGMDGLELIQAVREIDANLVVVLLTGFATVNNSMSALKAGAFRIIRKPFDTEELINTIESGVERCILKRQLESYRLHLEEMLQSKTKALQLAVVELKESYVRTMTTIVRLLDAHEENTATHSQVVSIMSLKLAEKMGITSEEELNNIKYGALLHDIGKIAVSDSILNKPDKLTAEEMKIIRNHPRKGYEIARNIPFLENAADIIHQHHEWYNGQGYPQGLKDEEICIGARLFAVIDTFEAMRSSKRAYKGEISVADVVKEINRCSGTQFDPAVVEVFNNCCDELNSLFEKYNHMADDGNMSQISDDFITQASF
jgi:diguanylate cyclase (GGDEF)-like protein/putative nucleotidyltransferase with HDIG domain